ncbi:MOSC domain-containing protein [Loktanella agnita]|uniref:MOSC domain-containing protein n=1 Tax=Loktanella agnita TaxID=287097 RepID=UPI003989D551
MIRVSALWRHPIKSHGREALDTVTLVTGQTMPWDRHWAVTHERTKFDPADPAWVGCRNFVIGSSTPALAGIWAQLDEETRTVTLRHQDLGTLEFRPDDPADVERFLDWQRPLCADASFQPTGIAHVPARGMTDSKFPSLSIMTRASHKAVEDELGLPLEPERWRGNIWLDGTAPWEECAWIGRDLRIGDAVLHIEEPIKRCKHTMVNPQTGVRDVDTLAALRDGWDHQNFGVYATVTQGGQISVDSLVEVI